MQTTSREREDRQKILEEEDTCCRQQAERGKIDRGY